MTEKQTRLWLIFEAKETLPAQKLKERLRALGVTYDCIACDSCESFLAVFKDCLKQVDKSFTVGIENNHKRLKNLSR